MAQLHGSFGRGKGRGRCYEAMGGKRAAGGCKQGTNNSPEGFLRVRNRPGGSGLARAGATARVASVRQVRRRKTGAPGSWRKATSIFGRTLEPLRLIASTRVKTPGPHLRPRKQKHRARRDSSSTLALTAPTPAHGDTASPGRRARLHRTRPAALPPAGAAARNRRADRGSQPAAVSTLPCRRPRMHL